MKRLSKRKRAHLIRIAEGWCPKREDGTHCVHWWDGDAPCCSCGDNTPTGGGR